MARCYIQLGDALHHQGQHVRRQDPLQRGWMGGGRTRCVVGRNGMNVNSACAIGTESIDSWGRWSGCSVLNTKGVVG